MVFKLLLYAGVKAHANFARPSHYGSGRPPRGESEMALSTSAPAQCHNTANSGSGVGKPIERVRDPDLPKR